MGNNLDVRPLRGDRKLLWDTEGARRIKLLIKSAFKYQKCRSNTQLTRYERMIEIAPITPPT